MRTRPPLAQRHEIRPVEAVEQVAYEFHLLRTEHEMAAVTRCVELIEGRAAGGALVLRVWLGLPRHRSAHHIGQGREDCMVHGDINVVAEARSLAAEQGHQHARQSLQSAQHVGYGHARHSWRAI